MSKDLEITRKEIENRILTVRGVQVMLDRDLAQMFQTETKYINRAVKRNPGCFPLEFAFQLEAKEWENLKFQFGTSSRHGGRGSLKDLRKKPVVSEDEAWFAFSKMDKSSVESILKEIENE